MTYVLVGAIGFLLGLIAHDLGVQSLDDATRRCGPSTGTCARCRRESRWARAPLPSCGRVAGRELVVAIVGALGALAFARAVGLDWELVAYLAFLTLTLALMVTDLEEFRIVDRLNLPGSAIVAVLLAASALAEGNLDGSASAASGERPPTSSVHHSSSLRFVARALARET